MLSLEQQQQQQQPQHKLERRYRSQSAESVTASLGMRGGGGGGGGEKQVYISNAGIRLRMVPSQRRGGSLLLHRSPLVNKILESMTAKCEEQFSASRGQMSRSSR